MTFRTEDLLHQWLDDNAWADVLRDGVTREFRRLSSDLVFVERQTKPAGVAVFRHSVAEGKESEFEAAQAELTMASPQFPGYEGTIVCSRRVLQGNGCR